MAVTVTIVPSFFVTLPLLSLLMDEGLYPELDSLVRLADWSDKHPYQLEGYTELRRSTIGIDDLSDLIVKVGKSDQILLEKKLALLNPRGKMLGEIRTELRRQAK